MDKMNPSKPIERIPVIVISGFLGSGKTTLLNRLLQHAPKSAVIINEFGSTAIDQQLLREHDVPMSVLAGGCLCCQVRGSLTPVLKNLRMAWETSNYSASTRLNDGIKNLPGDKPFERVIIETSGVANPEPVLDILLRERWLAARYHLQSVITTLSAVSGAETLARFPEAQAQIAWADVVALTHTDLASPLQLAAANAWLNKLAPTVACLNVIQGAVAPELILGVAKKIRQLPNTQTPVEHGFNSISVQFDQPISWPCLQLALEQLLKQYSQQLVRIKGVVFAHEHPEPLLIQAAAQRLYQPVLLPVRTTDDGKSRLVLITQGEIANLADELTTAVQHHNNAMGC
ncbi:MAG: GTP-binding protein [Methylococcaceae bacterium]|nr:GTP-binding protein [Methylococcaceae bacterium]MDZ4155222.1 GTP-binding protein [Methylococcales bacterium]MDP2393506.1 GTP-binding protein [Methylococcaceae bacterium]MDP3021376.1 GTP-binding protein [Methylococcaceae bacterium]MDP3391033.1 GTP-binding protein [Methylococcaceae bacterium]